MCALPEKRFRRTREDFHCLHCGAFVSGDGFTNHCPRCLFSRHVDIRPGDRAAECGALMPPVRARRDGKKGFMILHRCEACGHEKWNRIAADDDLDELTGLL